MDRRSDCGASARRAVQLGARLREDMPCRQPSRGSVSQACGCTTFGKRCR
jgi:hypothetical protein